MCPFPVHFSPPLSGSLLFERGLTSYSGDVLVKYVRINVHLTPSLTMSILNSIFIGVCVRDKVILQDTNLHNAKYKVIF